MGKRSSGKKRGIQRGVPKNKIRSKPQTNKSDGKRRVFGIEESVYFSLGKRCFDFWFFWSEKLYLAPFARTATGNKYVPLGGRRKDVHYFAWFFMFLMFLHKTWGLVVILLSQELKMETFMCISQFLFYFDTFCLSLGVIVRPQETMDLLNSWPILLSFLKELRNDVPSPLDDISLALELIALFLMTQGVAVTSALLSLAFSTLPTCYFPLVESLGLIPDGVLPRFAWQLIFFPFEYVTALPAMLMESLAGSIILIVLGVYKLYTNELTSVQFGMLEWCFVIYKTMLLLLLRRLQIRSWEDRAKLEHLYICMELHNRICSAWLKFAYPSIILSSSLAVILAAFVAIRYTELPFFCYIIFPSTAFALTVIIFWGFYQLLLTIRDSEELLGQLRSYEAPYLRAMPIAGRAKVLKRAKAMRPIEFPMGDFADFSVSVPVTVWEEIVNQVVFLLSL